MRLCWIGTTVVCVFELFVFLAFLQTNFLTTSPLHYFAVRILTPSGINFITAIICTLVLKSNRYTVAQKNMAASFAMYVLGSSVAIFHNYYKFLLVAEGLPIIMCAIFADRKILLKILHLCYVTFIISVIVMNYDDVRLGTVDLVTTVVCAFLFLYIIYSISKAIVIYQSEQISFIYESSQRQAELIQELKIEPLTKLYNRTALNGAMKSFVKKYNLGLAEPHMALIDLDHFKQINDTYGHAAGDEVLITLAQILKADMGSIRRAFRYGGEEFVLLFEIDSPKQVKDMVEQIRVDFCAHSFSFAPGENFTLSAGIAKLQPNWDDTTWFNAADEAMYHAKENGRNKVEIAQ